MWIKICANTNLEDALAAAELGADALGFVFAPSKRKVAAAEVRAIASQLPPSIERVGVFAGSTVEEIVRTVRDARLHTVQSHDSVDPGFTAQLRQRLSAEISIIQVLHWNADALDQDEIAARIGREMAALAPNKLLAEEGDRERVLIDTKLGDASGGLGVSFDWGRAGAVVGANPGLRVILAGGLRAENVAEAIRALRPWGVDVASGVEHAPGAKDYGKLRAFIENARGAV